MIVLNNIAIRINFLRRESVCWKKTNERFFAFNDTLSFPTNPALVSDAVNFRNGGQDNDG